MDTDDHSRSSSFRFKDNPEFILTVGVSHAGLVVYWGQVRIQPFPWLKIKELSFRRRLFKIVLRDVASAQDVTTYELEFSSSKLAWRFYTECIAYHQYFRSGYSTSSQVSSEQQQHNQECSMESQNQLASGCTISNSRSPALELSGPSISHHNTHLTVVSSPPATVAQLLPTNATVYPDTHPSESPSPIVAATSSTRRRSNRASWWFSCVRTRTQTSPSRQQRPLPVRHAPPTTTDAVPRSPRSHPRRPRNSPGRYSMARLRQPITTSTVNQAIPNSHCCSEEIAVARETQGASPLSVHWPTVTRGLMMSIQAELPHPQRSLPSAGATPACEEEPDSNHVMSVAPDSNHVVSMTPASNHTMSMAPAPSPLAESTPIRPNSPAPSPLLIVNGSSVSPSSWMSTVNTLNCIDARPGVGPARPPPRTQRTLPVTTTIADSCQIVTLSRTPSNLSQTSAGWHSTMGSIHFICIPVVATRAVRYSQSQDPESPYGLLANARIHHVNGLCVPVIPTTTLPVSYEAN